MCAKNVTDEYVDFLCMENREIAPVSLFVSLNSVNPETFTPDTEGGLEYNVDGNCRESFKNRERIGEKLYRCTYKNGSGAKAVFSEGGLRRLARRLCKRNGLVKRYRDIGNGGKNR